MERFLKDLGVELAYTRNDLESERRAHRELRAPLHQIINRPGIGNRERRPSEPQASQGFALLLKLLRRLPQPGPLTWGAVRFGTVEL
jgi:hypothetical protein